MDDQLKALIASERDKLDQAIPDPALFSLLMGKLEARKQKKRRLYFLKEASLSGIAAVFLIGFFVMFFADRNDSRMLVKGSGQDTMQENGQIAETHPSVDAEKKGPGDLRDLVDKKMSIAATSDEQRVFLVSSSPSTRITAIYAAEKHKKNRKPLLDALFEVLNNDPNTNVRMAALDVLSANMRDTAIRKRLVYAMVNQDEPMVQLMMIQLFSTTREKDFIEKLGQIIDDSKTDVEVREEARFLYTQYKISLN